MTVGGGFAYLYLLWFGIMTLVLPLSFIDSHFLSREYPRMKKEIQEDLKTELAAKRLIAERKARTAPFAGDTQSQVLLNNHDALVYPSGARTLTHKI